MCAINPKHKKRFIIDVYTSLPMDDETFDNGTAVAMLEAELRLNTEFSQYRFHLKEPRIAPVISAVCDHLKDIIQFHLGFKGSDVETYERGIATKLDTMNDQLERLIKEAE